MKGCFVLQRRFVYVGLELVALLRQRGAVDESCAYVVGREGRDLLLSQKEVRYTHIALDEDIFKRSLREPIDLPFLEKLEEEHGILWKFINVDRVVRQGQLVREYPYDMPAVSYEEMLRLVQGYAKHIEAFLAQEKPDFVFMFQPASLGTLTLQTIAKKLGIPVFMTFVPSTRNLVIVSEEYERLSGVEEKCKEHRHMTLEEVPMYKEARAFIEEFRAKPFTYSKVVISREKSGSWRQFDFLLPWKLPRTIYYNFFEIFVEWFSDPEKRTDYTTVNPFLHLYDRTKRKVRNFIGLKDLYDEYDPAKPFAFFPLMYEPEMAILLYAPYDTDQLQIARKLARSLPVGMYLYVKDHPQMVSYRPRRYYKELKKIPNVRLIHPAVSSFDLEKHAALIALINSTPGWEATLLGKPVITFGHAFYNALSSVHHSKTPEELPTLIKEALKKGGCPEEELTRFVAALFEDGASLDLMHWWEQAPSKDARREGLKNFAKLLAKKIATVRGA